MQKSQKFPVSSEMAENAAIISFFILNPFEQCSQCSQIAVVFPAFETTWRLLFKFRYSTRRKYFVYHKFRLSDIYLLLTVNFQQPTQQFIVQSPGPNKTILNQNVVFINQSGQQQIITSNQQHPQQQQHQQQQQGNNVGEWTF